MSTVLGNAYGFFQAVTAGGARANKMMLGVTVFCLLLVSSNAVLSSQKIAAGVEIYDIALDAPIPLKKPDLDNDKAIVVAMALPKELDFSNTSRDEKNQIEIAKKIFELQSKEQISEANKLLHRLNDKDLRGHVLAQRYLESTSYISTAEELKNWLKSYADYPQANDVYKLANRKGAEGIRKPALRRSIAGNIVTQNYRAKTYQTTIQRTKIQTHQYFDLKNSIKNHVQIKEPTKALNLLNRTKYESILDDVEYDRLRAEIAAGYLYANRLKHAQRLADASIKRSGAKAPQAAWIRGLVKWQEGQYYAAAKAFEMASNSPYSTGWMVASSSYWASRAYLRAGQKNKIRPLVEKAAQYPHSFYGVIANYALGSHDSYNWDMPKLTKNKMALILKTEQGKRAYKLIQSGQIDLAEKELSRMSNRNKKAVREALVAFAHHYKLAGLSYKIGYAFQPDNNQFYDAALYPEKAWDSDNGYKVDRALINAIIRQESRFQSGAKNASGATGLMQLMPRTAKYIANKHGGELNGQLNRLHEPMVNIAFGQNYIHYLLNHRAVGQDLMAMAIAYNAGPGTLSKWKREYAHIDDPLLFIEVIPFHETRAFVERVMANFWLYRMRYDQKLHSLDDVAEGRWARYISQDSGLVDVALR